MKLRYLHAQLLRDKLNMRRIGCARREPDRCVNRKAVGKIFRVGIYFGFSVEAQLMSIEVLVSTSFSPYGLV